MSYLRYAIYDLPENEKLAESGAHWLGWDTLNACNVPAPDFPGIESVTSVPRKYGFHATLKPPFRLADDCSFDALSEAVSQLASKSMPAVCNSLKVSTIGSFLAITPAAETSQIDQLAFQCVTSLDHLRAPLTDAEMSRRRAPGLTERQEQLLQDWGYPYIADEFNYHITLTGKLEHHELRKWHALAVIYFELPTPYKIDSLALVGENEDGSFELINRYRLNGNAD